MHKTIVTFVILFIVSFSERPLYMTWETVTVEATSQNVRTLSFVGNNDDGASSGILCEKGKDGFTEIIK